MGLRSGAQYIESLKERNPVIYSLGERIENVLEHAVLESTVATVAKTYDLAKNPKHKELLTTTSHLTGERISRFLKPFMSVDDLVGRQHSIRFLQRRLGSCALRCTGLGMGNTLFNTTYEIDQKLGTNYHQRYLDYLKYVQKEDLYLSGAMMDVKGDRSLSPGKQKDPDMYLRIVEEKKMVL